jgi:hypothetical protein
MHVYACVWMCTDVYENVAVGECACVDVRTCMDVYGCVWRCMEVYGCVWMCMKMCVCVCMCVYVCVYVCGVCLWGVNIYSMDLFFSTRLA